MPSLSEAIRRLVEVGLDTSKPAARHSAKSAAKAQELATHTINHLVDPAAPGEEKASRKRKLLKGPKEFREVRVTRRRSDGCRKMDIIGAATGGARGR